MIVSASELVASAKMHSSCITPEGAKEFYDKNDNVVVLDVREPHEADQSSLSMSINIPRGLLEMKVTEYCETEDTPILIHCAGGGRAALSAYTLQMMGYSNVHVIDAKFDEIKAALN